MTVKADPLQAAGSDVAMLSDTLRRGGSALESVPFQIKQLLESGVWRHFTTKLGVEVRHERFADFVTTPPLAGLGAQVATIRKLLVDDVAALDLLDQALQRQHGGDRSKPDNIRLESEGRTPGDSYGTSKDAALRRLRKDAPEVHARVVSGELSPHAGMVLAGLRPQSFTVRVTEPADIAATLRRRLPPDVLAAVLTELSNAAG